ncbi:alpha-xenorhabdolysin family binary toxin subunit A [Proteus hauseri]|uniref:alpha-xenorhabdolysin family binary toxin subunit A n=1 Tax=Proteus hauseri TaxID=183417 RepID=UPI00100977F2|nr:alpha-xenorhabdolysin family binary toxin subunit A [Proteus hauseri]QAV21903.1 toxin [Proteus hauseri]
MDTTIFEYVDKIIEKTELPEVTLGLILGKNIEGGRSPGIFTSYDLKKIKNYIDKILILPYQKETVIEFLGYDDINISQISSDNIQALFLRMREHAFGWNKIEYAIKQQAIDLEIIGREITTTGEHILLFISQMPLLDKINIKLEDISEEETSTIKYTQQDKEVTTQLITILESMKSDINDEYQKTVKIKNMVCDFRAKITGGESSNGTFYQSIYYDIISKKRIINEYLSSNNTSFIEEKSILENELEALKEEYKQFVKLAFTGLAFGIVGVIITGGIFGAKAEEARKKKNTIIEKLNQVNNNIKIHSNISLCLQKFQTDLDEIEQYIEDANMALEHLEYMWQTTLTEINASLINLKKVDNAMELIRFSIYLEKMISPWYMVIGYSKEMIAIFDEALSAFYASK